MVERRNVGISPFSKIVKQTIWQKLVEPRQWYPPQYPQYTGQLAFAHSTYGSWQASCEYSWQFVSWSLHVPDPFMKARKRDGFLCLHAPGRKKENKVFLFLLR